MRRKRLLVLGVPFVCLVGWGVSRLDLASAADEPGRREKAPAGGSGTREDRGAQKTWTTAVTPKPLSQGVKKGLDWLVEHQLPGGGWGQGEESPQMRGSHARSESLRDTPDVADTCIAALALLRSGSTPREGLYRDAIVKAVGYVRSQVEASDSESMSVSRVQGTRVQQKLGPNIDTFLASMLLAEVKGRMPGEEEEKAVDLALHKVLGKIERHQKQDGSFEGQGWAPILAQAMAGKGINRARQAGARVSDVTLARAADGATLAFRSASAPTPTSTLGRSASASYMMGGMMGAAGVELYSRAASVGVLQDSVNTGKLEAQKLRNQVASTVDARERANLEGKLARIAEAEKVQGQAQAAIVERLDDERFIAGFGSNGGEEFLSYMNIAESLVVKGGDEWKRWDARMTANLDRAQNGDGSWSGHHCITGRTFCTASALLVLMADRTPISAQADGDAPSAAR